MNFHIISYIHIDQLILQINSKHKSYGLEYVVPDRIIGVRVSNISKKKYTVTILHKNRINNVHFGSKNERHYFDKLNHYRYLDTFDSKLRSDFFKNMSAITDKHGDQKINDPLHPIYWEARILW